LRRILPKLPVKTGIVVRIKATLERQGISGPIKEPCRYAQCTDPVTTSPRGTNSVGLALHVISLAPSAAENYWRFLPKPTVHFEHLLRRPALILSHFVARMICDECEIGRLVGYRRLQLPLSAIVAPEVSFGAHPQLGNGLTRSFAPYLETLQLQLSLLEHKPLSASPRGPRWCKKGPRRFPSSCILVSRKITMKIRAYDVLNLFACR
jgi:hypothetical protein